MRRTLAVLLAAALVLLTPATAVAATSSSSTKDARGDVMAAAGSGRDRHQADQAREEALTSGPTR